MIRSFDWRDLWLLHQVQDRGLCLDSQQAHTRGANVMQAALWGLITPGRNTFTLVARPSDDEEVAAVGQITHRMGEPHARFTFIGPEDVISESNGTKLLDSLSKVAGERGALHLIADVDERSPAFECLRKAGFAIYARQRIWHFDTPSPSSSPDADASWRRLSETDEEAVNHLYHNTVPVLVQQVEQPPTFDKGDLVHWKESDLLGYLDIESGPLGVWVHPYFHPAVEDLDNLLAFYLSEYRDAQRRPLYFEVRSYQGWVGHALERLGGSVCSDQAVMVRRLAAKVRRPTLAPLPSVEGTRAEPTTPFAHSQHSPLLHSEQASHD